MIWLQELENIRQRAKEKREGKAAERLERIQTKLDKEKQAGTERVGKSRVEEMAGDDDVTEMAAKRDVTELAGKHEFKLRQDEEESCSEDEGWNGGLWMFPGGYKNYT